jgi:hypothetical protein
LLASPGDEKVAGPDFWAKLDCEQPTIRSAETVSAAILLNLGLEDVSEIKFAVCMISFSISYVALS